MDVGRKVVIGIIVEICGKLKTVAEAQDREVIMVRKYKMVGWMVG